MSFFNVVTQQGYYYLYALYFDYPINNAFFREKEDRERVKEMLEVVQRIEELVQPYRKTWALRLFTERSSLARFSPELVNEAFRQLGEIVKLLGAPPGWPRRKDGRSGPSPGWAERKSVAPVARRARVLPPALFQTRSPPPFLQSPIDYRLIA